MWSTDNEVRTGQVRGLGTVLIPAGMTNETVTQAIHVAPLECFKIPTLTSDERDEGGESEREARRHGELHELQR